MEPVAQLPPGRTGLDSEGELLPAAAPAGSGADGLTPQLRPLEGGPDSEKGHRSAAHNATTVRAGGGALKAQHHFSSPSLSESQYIQNTPLKLIAAHGTRQGHDTAYRVHPCQEFDRRGQLPLSDSIVLTLPVTTRAGRPQREAYSWMSPEAVRAVEGTL